MKYLTFRLAAETFGVPVELVQEVLEHTPATRVPRCPDFLLGVVNVRGSIVAVMDLRRRLGIEEGEVSVLTRFIVLDLRIDGQDTPVAMMADGVDEVVDIAEDDVDPAPTADASATAAHLLGVAKTADGMVLILDADSLVTAELLEESFGAHFRNSGE